MAFGCGIENTGRFGLACWPSESPLPLTIPLPPDSTEGWPFLNAEARLDFSSENLEVFTCEMAYSTMNSTSSRVSMSA